MDDRKRQTLRDKGWSVGNAGDLLEMSVDEARFIELKLALSGCLREERTRQGVTQVELSRLIGSSQSRVAKMEAGDPTVTIDLLLKALLAMGVTRQRLATVIA